MERPGYELLLEGATQIDHQARGGFALAMDASGHLFGCALGAIVLAAGGNPARARESKEYRSASLARYRQLLVATRAATRPCPARGRWFWQRRHCGRVSQLGNQIAHLNDRHGWSFARIADWLRQEHPYWRVPVDQLETEPMDASAVLAAVQELVQTDRHS